MVIYYRQSESNKSKYVLIGLIVIITH